MLEKVPRHAISAPQPLEVNVLTHRQTYYMHIVAAVEKSHGHRVPKNHVKMSS